MGSRAARDPPKYANNDFNQLQYINTRDEKVLAMISNKSMDDHFCMERYEPDFFFLENHGLVILICLLITNPTNKLSSAFFIYVMTLNIVLK